MGPSWSRSSKCIGVRLVDAAFFVNLGPAPVLPKVLSVSADTRHIHRVNDVTYLWSHYDRHFVGQHRRTVRS